MVGGLAKSWNSKVNFIISVGEPIDVQKIEEPSPEDIDKIHKIFLSRLIKLFEEEKCKYMENSEGVHLEIV